MQKYQNIKQIIASGCNVSAKMPKHQAMVHMKESGMFLKFQTSI